MTTSNQPSKLADVPKWPRTGSASYNFVDTPIRPQSVFCEQDVTKTKTDVQLRINVRYRTFVTLKPVNLHVSDVWVKDLRRLNSERVRLKAQLRELFADAKIAE